jgi:soluble lytic murein transglycosylase-like protein
MLKSTLIAMFMMFGVLLSSAVVAYPTDDAGHVRLQAVRPAVQMKSPRYETVRKKVAFMFKKYPKAARFYNEAELAYWVDESSRLYDVPYELLLSKAAVESSLNPKAVSRKGALGLMQIMPNIHGNTRKELFDYRVSLMSAAKVISRYRDACGGLRCAVESYNVGITAHRKGARNAEYVRRIESHMRYLGASLHKPIHGKTFA